MNTPEYYRAQIEEHRLKRPDALKAKAPNASEKKYQAWVKWCDEMEHLKTLLEMAEAVAMSQWKDKQGKIIEPDAWIGRGDLRDMKNTKQRGTPGRPALGEISKESLQRRIQRARKAKSQSTEK